MRVALLTREYPPEVYGGAGVHVEYLARELRVIEDVTVHAWDAGDVPHRAWGALAGDAPELAALRALSIDLTMAARTADADIVHSHTWYANLGGHLSKLAHGIPHVATVHSLEPLRPWKAEQLGGGYAISSWAEKTALEAADAVIAVSRGTRDDVLRVYPAIDPARIHVIYNGIDTDEYAPDDRTDVLERSASTPHVPRLCSSAESPGRRASSTCFARRASSIRRRSSSCAPDPRTRPSSAPRSSASSASYAPSATA